MRQPLVPLAIVFLALLVTAPVARAQDAAADFHRFDRNGDGKLTREECPPDLRAQFDRVVTNNDGFISFEEFQVCFRQRIAGGAPPGGIPAPHIPDNVRGEPYVNYAGSDNPAQRLEFTCPSRPGGISRCRSSSSSNKTLRFRTTRPTLGRRHRGSRSFRSVSLIHPV
jgi:hypothetical protein